MSYEFEQRKLYAYLGDELVDLFKRHRCIIAGGTITSLFCNRDINDIDVYFRDQESVVNFIYEIWDDNHYVVTHTKKATLFLFNHGHTNINVQLVHFNYFDSPLAIFDTFDFTVCMGAYDFASESFVLHDNFMQHNSQRLLKFNAGTAYPLVSLLRVQKYRDKQYTISKPEFLRIALTCMTLDITSYAQLKEHLGGMYGINYDKMFADVEDAEFSMERAIDIIANFTHDDDYFNKPVPVEFDNVNDIVDNITGYVPRYVELNKRWYRLRQNGVLERGRAVDDPIEVDASEYISALRLYKFVSKGSDGRYFSYYDPSFEYIVGEEIVPKSRYLYFNQLASLSESTFAHHEDKVCIEASIIIDDFAEADRGTITVTKCKVLREVPIEEYERYL